MSIFHEKYVSLPTLYKKNVSGNIQIWNIEVYLLNNLGKEQKIKKEYLGDLPNGWKALIITRWGIQGGKIQETIEEISQGKNLGKSNETNAFSQAISEAKSTWTKKQERNNYTPIEEQVERAIISPMLLKKFEDAKKYIKYPALISPKFDGSRMIAHYSPKEKRFILLSRTGNEFVHLNHIREDLKKITFLVKNPNWWFDGEVYSPDITFEEIQSICRKSLDLATTDIKNQNKIKYYVFDLFDQKDPSIPYRERLTILIDLFKKHKKELSHLVLVPQKVVYNEKQTMDFHKKMVAQNEEGSVIRNLDAPYELGKRSAHVQKIKDFITEEYPIIGFKEGKGKNKGTVIFRVRTKEGKPFDVVPEGSYEQRKVWFKEGNKLIGKMLTVKYKELTAQGIPRFPIGIAIRDYE